MPETGIVAALEQEVRGAVRRWRRSSLTHAGRNITCYHSARVALVCGGMGAEAARRAAEALVIHGGVSTLVSIGYAGAATPNLRTGSLHLPERVVDGESGELFVTAAAPGSGTLVSLPAIADFARKRDLHARLDAALVDMEAATVARTARAYGLPFFAVKAVLDELHAELPAVGSFIRPDGGFRALPFLAHAAVRPASWWPLWQMTRDASRASAVLCRWLAAYNEKSASEALPEGVYANTR